MEDSDQRRWNERQAQFALIEAQTLQAIQDGLRCMAEAQLNEKKTRWYELVIFGGAAGAFVSIGIGVTRFFYG